MASHKTLLYLGIFFILFDIIVPFPHFRISILGILLLAIGYFKFKIYSWIMWFIWFLIVIQFITDIGEVVYKFTQPSSKNASKGPLTVPAIKDEEEKTETESNP